MDLLYRSEDEVDVQSMNRLNSLAEVSQLRNDMVPAGMPSSSNSQNICNALWARIGSRRLWTYFI